MLNLTAFVGLVLLNGLVGSLGARIQFNPANKLADVPDPSAFKTLQLMVRAGAVGVVAGGCRRNVGTVSIPVFVLLIFRREVFPEFHAPAECGVVLINAGIDHRDTDSRSEEHTSE